MTESEFKNDVLPRIHALWPRLVTLNVKPAREHDPADLRRFNQQNTAAAEKNRQVWRIVNRYMLEDALDAIRRVGETHLDFPEHKGRGWVLQAIRQELRDRYGVPAGEDDGRDRDSRPHFDPAKWTWGDECTLWHILGDMARNGEPEPNELDVAHTRLGKNPSIEERDHAYSVLCGHIDKQRSSAVARRDLDRSEAEQRYAYPREAVAAIRRDYPAGLPSLRERLAQRRARVQAANAEAEAVTAEINAMLAEMGG